MTAAPHTGHLSPYISAKALLRRRRRFLGGVFLLQRLHFHQRIARLLEPLQRIARFHSGKQRIPPFGVKFGRRGIAAHLRHAAAVTHRQQRHRQPLIKFAVRANQLAIMIMRHLHPVERAFQRAA